MIAHEPPPGSVITWFARFTIPGNWYQYLALRVAGRGWFTTDTRNPSPWSWAELQARIGDNPTFVPSGWASLPHVVNGEVVMRELPTGAGINRCTDTPCRICQHTACGWCPDCSPGVPEWTT